MICGDEICGDEDLAMARNDALPVGRVERRSAIVKIVLLTDEERSCLPVFRLSVECFPPAGDGRQPLVTTA